MSYTLAINLALGSSQSGLTLSAQLVDTTGANVGAAITTGFVEIGNGNYLWTNAAYPDGFRGGVVFSAAGVTKAFVAVNPQEVENSDVKVSTRADGSVYTSARAGKLDNLDVAVSTRPTVSQIVTGILDELLASHTVAGSVARALASILGYDPLASTVPGTYPSGSAGAALGLIQSGIVSTSPIVTVNGSLMTLIAGDDYKATDGRQIDITDTGNNWPVLTSGSAVLKIVDQRDGSTALSVAGGIQTADTVRFEPTAVQTLTLAPDAPYKYAIVATLSNGDIVTLVEGVLHVQGQP